MELFDMEKLIALTVRVTQILKDDGWKFVDHNGTVEKVYNEDEGETFTFQDESEFVVWVIQQATKSGIPLEKHLQYLS